MVVTTALFDAISGAPRVRNQLLRVVKKSQNRVFQLRIREDGLGFVEGLNNKIRVFQRRAYGLKDEEYLRLKVLSCVLPPI